MLHRVVLGAINRIIVPSKSLLRCANDKRIIRKSSTALRRHTGNFLRSRKLDHVNCHHELCTQEQHSIKNIRNVFCKEISAEDIGNLVHVRGVVVGIIKGRYVVIKDKTGAIRLVIDKKRRHIRDWFEKLEKYSFVKVVGIVREKPKSKDDNDTVCKDPFDVVIDYVISSLPPLNGNKEKMTASQESEMRTGLSEDLSTAEIQSSWKETSTKMTGKKIQVFGRISSIDGDGNFVLTCSNGSVPVDFYVSAGDNLEEMERLNVGDLVVVEGLSADCALMKTQSQASSTNMDGKLRVSANLVRKLREDDFLELKDPDVNRYTIRSHNCGELNENYIGQRVRLMGWVAFIRMNRFILLQDKYGLIQLTIPKTIEEMDNLQNLTLESVISVEGIVSLRPPGNENKNMKTGAVEINVTDLKIISSAGTLPFYLTDPRPARPTQLQYKYLDMRQHPESRNILKFRGDILHQMRRFLVERVGFLEIETPTLFSRTPGGAQEFVVPTRKKGEFYALVQSPQQFKQLLMIGGLDRYFQIARCYRDEEAQKDRQPEFTQLDIEMSFCDREGIIQLMEDIVKFVWPKGLNPIKFPFPRMTYQEAMTSYGTDKPDMRFDWKIKDLTDVFKQAGKSCSGEINMETYMDLEDFTALTLVVSDGKSAFPQIKQGMEEVAMKENCKIFAFNLSSNDRLSTILNKLFRPPIPEVLKSQIKCKAGDVVALGFGSKKNLLKSFGKVRVVSAKIVEEQGITVYDRANPFSFLWIVDFPLFEEKEGVTCSVHHPFTQPHPDDVEMLRTDPLKMRGLNYDLVLNGNEIGGGSIRIHDAELQREVLEDILKLDTSYFKHLLNALSYGAPIHGGFALGVDRFIGLLRGTTSIVDVMAFPKYSTGRDPLTGAPSDIPKEDKELYHLE